MSKNTVFSVTFRLGSPSLHVKFDLMKARGTSLAEMSWKNKLQLVY